MCATEIPSHDSTSTLRRDEAAGSESLSSVQRGASGPRVSLPRVTTFTSEQLALLTSEQCDDPKTWAKQAYRFVAFPISTDAKEVWCTNSEESPSVRCFVAPRALLLAKRIYFGMSALLVAAVTSLTPATAVKRVSAFNNIFVSLGGGSDVTSLVLVSLNRRLHSQKDEKVMEEFL